MMPPKRGVANDEGSTLLLIIFSGALALSLILGVAAATSLYLERKRLFTLADGAALAASESFNLSSVVRDGAGGILRPVLTSTDVAQAAQQYIARATARSNDKPGGFRIESLALSRAITSDGRSATVELTSQWHPPVISLFLPDGIQLTVQSTARSVFF